MHMFLTLYILDLYFKSYLLTQVCFIFFHVGCNKPVDCFRVISITSNVCFHIASWLRHLYNLYVEILSLITTIYLAEPCNICFLYQKTAFQKGFIMIRSDKNYRELNFRGTLSAAFHLSS